MKVNHPAHIVSENSLTLSILVAGYYSFEVVDTFLLVHIEGKEKAMYSCLLLGLNSLETVVFLL